MGDRVTVLRCSPTLVMAKTWSSDGEIRGYDKAKHFSVESTRVAGIRELSSLLTELEDDPQACVIRGEPAKGVADATRILRRGENFSDVARHAVMIEVDAYRAISASPLEDPLWAIEEYIELELPAAFYKAAFHWQLSNSAGSERKGDTLIRPVRCLPMAATRRSPQATARVLAVARAAPEIPYNRAANGAIGPSAISSSKLIGRFVGRQRVRRAGRTKTGGWATVTRQARSERRLWSLVGRVGSPPSSRGWRTVC